MEQVLDGKGTATFADGDACEAHTHGEVMLFKRALLQFLDAAKQKLGGNAYVKATVTATDSREVVYEVGIVDEVGSEEPRGVGVSMDRALADVEVVANYRRRRNNIRH